MLRRLLPVLVVLGLVLALGACSAQSSPPPAGNGVNVLTYHNDNMRSGLNAQETILTPANVNAKDFGKISFYPTDGKVHAQPLYVSKLTVAGKTHNVLVVATEHDSVYAFDADTGQVLWQTSLLGQGETPSDKRNCGQVAPEIGITATPVIDLTAGPHGTIYAVAMSKDAQGNYFQRLHALDLATGAELSGSPTTIQAKYPGTGDNSSNGYVIFDPAQYEERASLLLLNGVVYLSWTSHCDHPPYTGWVMGYDGQTLAQASVLDFTPNGSRGSVWGSGAGPAADDEGNIYFMASNGTFDTKLDAHGFPIHGDYGNAFLKLSTKGGKLVVADYFNMYNTVEESNHDEDLGSGGTLLLPDFTDATGKVRHLAVGAGKDANIYVVDRDDMGKFHPDKNDIYQELKGGLHGPEFAMPAYFNNTVYYGAVNDVIRAFTIKQARLSKAPTAKTSNSFVYPGTTPSISANGTTGGIVWAVKNSNPAVLYAYDASNLTELYNSNQASGGRDHFGPGNKFITPTIADGKVFVGTTDGVAVFGLLH